MRDANLRLCCDTLVGHGPHASSCVGKHGEGLTPLPRKDDGHEGGAPPKRRWRLLPWDALGDVVDVLTWACTRKEPPPYGEESWRGVPDALVRYEDALLRHLAEWHEGRRLGRRGREVVDKQSGLPTLAHAACCALFLLALDRRE